MSASLNPNLNYIHFPLCLKKVNPVQRLIQNSWKAEQIVCW